MGARLLRITDLIALILIVCSGLIYLYARLRALQKWQSTSLSAFALGLFLLLLSFCAMFFVPT